MNSFFLFLGALSLLAWGYLLFFRGGFWRADQRLSEADVESESLPSLAAVIPARDEAAVIGRAVGSLLDQDYAGDLRIIVVDDGSTDGTANAVTDVAGGTERVMVTAGRPLPAGWAGKMWAVSQGIEKLYEIAPDTEYILLTDADIEHGKDMLRHLVAQARAHDLDLVSCMIMLESRSAWEKLLIPAFVFFFQKLYPFPWVNNPKHATAAAAGGCMLVRRRALEQAGGIGAIRDRLIDDCALARIIKARGPIWLGLTKKTRSLRTYKGLAELWGMVARTAFVQLDHSAALLVLTVAGMGAFYLAPPVALAAGIIIGQAGTTVLGGAAYGAMIYAYGPTLRLYGQKPWRGMLLPVAGFFYTLMTVDSAFRHWRGRGGGWKGRHYGPSAKEGD